MKYFNFFCEKDQFIAYVAGKFEGSSTAISYGGEPNAANGKKINAKWNASPLYLEINFQSEEFSQEIKLEWEHVEVPTKEDLAELHMTDGTLEIQAMDHDKFYLHYTRSADNKRKLIFSGMLLRKKETFFSRLFSR